MRSLEDHFLEHALHTRLLSIDGRILIAVSGGLDSAVLLHLICTVFPDAPRRVAHYDHGWREDGREDVMLVRKLASDYGLAFTTERAVRPSHTEKDARAERYAFLIGAADAWAADAIATAHHADDQAETILFRIARGAGTSGLRGIPARRGRIVRPLLPFHRVEIKEYARAHGLVWREDSTNRDTRHSRNRIRHDLLPALEKKSAGIAAQLLEIGSLARAAEMHWDSALRSILEEVVIARDDSGFTLASTVLLGYHPHIRARVLRKLAHRLGTSLGQSGTHLGSKFISTGRSGTGIELAHGIRLEREFDRFLLKRAVPVHGATAAAMDIAAAIPDIGNGAAEARIGGKRVRIRWSVEVQDEPHFMPIDVAFDAAGVRFPLVLRGWQPGDRIRLAYGSKKLKKLFVERRVGRSERQQVPVLAEAGSGAVLWIGGIARAATAVPVSGAPTFRIRIEE